MVKAYGSELYSFVIKISPLCSDYGRYLLCSWAGVVDEWIQLLGLGCPTKVGQLK